MQIILILLNFTLLYLSLKIPFQSVFMISISKVYNFVIETLINDAIFIESAKILNKFSTLPELINYNYLIFNIQ